MTAKERLVSQTLYQEADRVPTIGGWIMGASNLADLAEIDLASFLTDPEQGTIRAHLNLHVDGVVDPVVPTSADQIRTGFVEEARFEGIEPEVIAEAAEKVPDEKEILAAFDHKAETTRFRTHFESAASSWRGIVRLPNFWEIGGHFPLYGTYGYTAFLSACALYPEAVERIWWGKSILSRERAKILALLYRELDLVPTMFCGEDLCSMRGPLCSVEFLRRHYLPSVKMIIDPLVDSGVRMIHHCDGDVRPIIDDLLELGFRGFQGFQYECGVSIRDLRARQTCFGESPLIWAGMSVSRTLPFGSPDDVAAEVEGFYRDTDDGHGLFLFTSNVSGVEVPPDNLRAGYRRAHTLQVACHPNLRQ